MSKNYRLGLGRSKSGKILDRNTKWFNDALGVLKHITEHPEDSGKSLYVSINGAAYVKTSLDECRKEINHVNHK